MGANPQNGHSRKAHAAMANRWSGAWRGWRKELRLIAGAVANDIALVDD
jgi:hypothetical protein